MSEMSKEERKEYMKAYYEQNKDKIAERMKAYHAKNKEKKSEYNRAYSAKNKSYMKAYNQTEKGKKTHRITHWKSSGVISEDYDTLYDKYINTLNCEECGAELTVDKKMTSTTRCLDHCHTTGLFRNVLCNGCNVRRR